MRIALINSGLGLLAAAAEVHRLRPDADLVLSMDPDGMPWGPRTPDDIAARSLACARAAAVLDPDVLIFACNSGSVHALGPLRAEFEPGIPVVGTVPAIKPAAAHSGTVAIWATTATTGSAYQRRLIADFAANADVTEVACPGLADAIHLGDTDRASAIITESARRTPPGCGAVVLGCTEYELAAELISAAVPGAVLFGSAAAVAAQALRRVVPASSGSPKNGSLSPIAPNTSSPAPGGPAPGSQAHGSPLSGSFGAHGHYVGPPSSANGTATNGAPSNSTASNSIATNGAAASDSTPNGRPPNDGTPPGSTPNGAVLAAVPDEQPHPDQAAARTGQVWIILSGRHADLPAAALSYPAGRLLAALPRGPVPTSGHRHPASQA